MSAIPNLKVKTANAYGPNCLGCKHTKSDIMVTFGSPTPYGGDNRPSGPEEPERFVDVFMDKATATKLPDELTRALEEERRP